MLNAFKQCQEEVSQITRPVQLANMRLEGTCTTTSAGVPSAFKAHSYA